MDRISGLVVAGGRSARLGTDKRALHLGGLTLLERAVALVAALSDDVMIAMPQDGIEEKLGRLGTRVVTDPLPDRGPMAGILAGLQHARNQRLLVIPVDMPLLTIAFLRSLVERDPGAAVTVARWRMGLEPLVAVYDRSCAAELAALVGEGTTAIHAFISSTTLRVRIVEEPEIGGYGAPADLFLNINTPGDLTQAQRRLAAPPAPPERP